MSVSRFVGKNSREAMAQVRAAWGDDAVVLANRPITGGVEILAMPGTAMAGMAAAAAQPQRPPPVASAAPAAPVAPAALVAPAVPAPPAVLARAGMREPAAAPVAPMSTVSFQEFVRERQRLQETPAAMPAAMPTEMPVAPPAALFAPVPAAAPLVLRAPAPGPGQSPAPLPMPGTGPGPMPASGGVRARMHLPEEPGRFAAHALREEMARAQPVPQPLGQEAMHEMKAEMKAQIEAMHGAITSQLANFSWFDTVRRSPSQTQLLRLMLGNGFSAALARRLVHRLPAGRSGNQPGDWLAEVLVRNLRCAEADSVQERGGVFALVGPTGVGKTTTTAKLAANFALRHGAASVGLITMDTYRLAASDQLRAFGRILNIPVHTARDAATLADFLNLFARKKLVLIDTVGVSQRDPRLPELFSALPADRVSRLLVLGANAQAETLEEVALAYGAKPGARCIVTKLDEAARCGAVIDVVIRHQLQVEGFANGQRVPEDWHAARAPLLVHKALLRQPATAFTPDDDELGLMVTAPQAMAARGLRLEVPRV